MTELSVPLAGTRQQSAEEQSGSAAPVILGLSMITISLLAALGLWVLLVDDPLGGQPQASEFIETATVLIDPDLVGVADVRPSMTPDPNDVSIPAETPAPPATGRTAVKITTPATAAAAPRRPVMEPAQAGPALRNVFVSSGSEPQRLSVFPIENLVTRTEQGLIPKRSSDGQTAFSAYARPAKSVPDGPKIALVIGGVGLSERATGQAITALPPTTALAFSAYTAQPEKWKKLARENGFELLIEAPMEPFNFPDNDPGPHTLLVNASATENQSKLEWILSRMSNYIGVIPAMGARFTADQQALTALMTELNRRGLAYVDPATSVRSIAKRTAAEVSTDELGHLPFLKVDLVLDKEPARASIEQHLIQLEELSGSTGLAVGYAALRPATVEILAEWARLTEQRGITLIPLSTAINLSIPGI